MEDPIRCPYCVYRDEFKIMISLGTCFVCEKCGHIVAPEHPTFLCPCLKCKQLNRACWRGFCGSNTRPHFVHLISHSVQITL